MTVTVRDRMTTDVLTVVPSCPVADVMALLRDHHIRHLPVVDAAGVLHGLITDRDVSGRAAGPLSWLDDAEQDEALHAMRALEVMTDELVTIAPDAPLTQAGQLLLSRKLGCLPVVADGRLVGIVTEADFVRAWVDLGDRPAIVHTDPA